jgi:hypothetical protein
MKEKLKKYGPFILLTIAGILIYFWYKKYAASQAALQSSNDAAAQYAAQQAALQAATGAAGLSGAPAVAASSSGICYDQNGNVIPCGGTTQPSTSASGLPNVQSAQYVSPAPLQIPSATTATAGSNGTALPSGTSPALAAALGGGNPVNPATAPNLLPTGWNVTDPNSAAIALSNAPASAPEFQAGSAPCTNPFICTPQYIALMQQQEASTCATDPTGTACGLINLTDPNQTGAPTAAGAALEASNVCEQAEFNTNVFGQAANPNCQGTSPSQSLYNTLLNQYGGGSSSTNVPGANTPAPSQPGAPGSTATPSTINLTQTASTQPLRNPANGVTSLAGLGSRSLSTVGTTAPSSPPSSQSPTTYIPVSIGISPAPVTLTPPAPTPSLPGLTYLNQTTNPTSPAKGLR